MHEILLVSLQWRMRRRRETFGSYAMKHNIIRICSRMKSFPKKKI